MFCKMPFTHSYVDGEIIKPCCLFEGDCTLRDVRKQFLNKIKPDGCRPCYEKEDLGRISSRQWYNRRFPDIEFEPDIDYHKPSISHMDYNSKIDISDYKTDYNGDMSDLHIVPRIMLDYETTKYGLYMFSDDMIGNVSLFGGLSMKKAIGTSLMIISLKSLIGIMNLFNGLKKDSVLAFLLSAIGK